MNQENQLPTSVTGAKSNRRQGKNSKALNDQKFRYRVGKNVADEFRSALEADLKLFDTEDTRPIQTTISNIHLTSQPKAVPISVTTRGVGFSTAIFYDRIGATWNMHAIAEIATIHQVYRVHLWMAHYKVYLAQQLQTEMRSGPRAFETVVMPYEFREVLETISEVPSLMSFVLGCIGKIQSGGKVYHMGYSTKPAEKDLVEFYSLCVNPDNIRSILDSLTPNQDVNDRIGYLAYNSIPGLRIENNVLMNADEVYPQTYTADMLRNDVHCYKNLLTRVQARLPRHAIRPFSWSGRALVGGLWSCSRIKCSVTATFKIAETNLKRARSRSNSGEVIATTSTLPTVGVFSKSTVVGEYGDYWCMAEMDHQQSIVGMTSMVGEECFLYTRYEMNSHYSATVNPITTMYAVADAPR